MDLSRRDFIRNTSLVAGTAAGASLSAAGLRTPRRGRRFPRRSPRRRCRAASIPRIPGSSTSW
jgi:hypothetical protein